MGLHPSGSEGPTHAFTQMCIDLVGPVHQQSHSSDKYLLVMIDPFTHFVWIELISTKDADSVLDAFVRLVLLHRLECCIVFVVRIPGEQPLFDS